MTDWVIVFILLGEVVILTRLDRMMFGTWLTPVTLLGVPFAAVMLLAFLFGPALGFLPLFAPSVLVWAGGLLVLWVGGLPVALSLGHWIRPVVGLRRSFAFEAVSERLAVVLAWLSIPVIFLHFLRSIQSVGGVLGLGTEAFADIYGGGLGAHLLVLCTMLFILLVGVARRENRLALVTIGVLFLLMLLRQAKYSVILPLWAGLMYRVASGRMRLTVRGIAMFVLVAYAIFNAAYLIGFWALDPTSVTESETYSWLLQHFAAYGLSGVLPLGSLVQQGVESVPGDPAVTFSSLTNLFAFATGADLVSAGNEFTTIISANGAKESNVATIFGPLLIGLGYGGAAVYTLGLGVVCYLSFAAAMLTRNAWIVVIWLFYASMLALSWYSSMFVLLIALEAPVFCLLLAACFSLARARGAAPVPAGAT